jgi:L-rhamnose mutarotase
LELWPFYITPFGNIYQETAMKKSTLFGFFTMIFLGSSSAQPIAPIYGPTNPKVSETSSETRYFGSVIELKPDKEKLYRELHADVWKEVLAAIAKANIRNYHIFIAELQGKKYLFSYFEYHGTDLKKDFASMAEDTTTREKWWPITDGCQERIPGTPSGDQWLNMESVMSIPLGQLDLKP